MSDAWAVNLYAQKINVCLDGRHFREAFSIPKPYFKNPECASAKDSVEVNELGAAIQCVLGPKSTQSPSLAGCHSALPKHVASWRLFRGGAIGHRRCERLRPS